MRGPWSVGLASEAPSKVRNLMKSSITESEPSASSGSTQDLSPLMGSCPIPISDYPGIVLAHGSGGKLSQQLIQKIVLPQFRNELLEPAP